MREILFRGKRLDNGEWVEGGYFFHYGECRIVAEGTVSDYIIHYPVDPSTVGQFTGLLDEKGKRIFEGSVITSHTGKIFEVKFGQHEDVEGISESNGWFASGSYGDLSLGEDWGGHEVIGTTHDNPELLEVTPDE